MTLEDMLDAEALCGGRLCRYPEGDELPYRFCGDPVAAGYKSYCPEHAALCNGGAGKDWQALAGMMALVEQTIVKSSEVLRERPETAGVDVELSEKASWIGSSPNMHRKTNMQRNA